MTKRVDVEVCPPAGMVIVRGHQPEVLGMNIRIVRRRGRPENSSKVATHAQRHGIETAARKFNVSLRWVEQCIKRHTHK